MDHVRLDGDSLKLHFVGKGGVEQRHEVDDPVLAGYVRARREQGAGGVDKLFPHDSGDTLKFMKQITSQRFLVHDIRTWYGTVMADRLVQTVIKERGEPTTIKEYKALRKEVGTAVSASLGNTPTMALKAYIHPAVFDGLEPPKAPKKGSA